MNKMLKDKRGLALASLYPAVLAIVLIGIALGVGIFVLNETADAISNTEFTVNSENVSVVTAGTAVATATTDCFNTFAVSEVANQTGVLVPASNYTVNADTGTIGNTSSFYGKNDWTVNYTYLAPTAGTISCARIGTTSTGVGGLASWIAVIVVVLAAAIVLGVVINSFGRGSSV